jgi:hypothetical protein
VRNDDADETVGTIESDDAAGFDPLPVLRALHSHGAPAVVMGQVAGILHGSVELTGDLARGATVARHACRGRGWMSPRSWIGRRLWTSMGSRCGT